MLWEKLHYTIIAKHIFIVKSHGKRFSKILSEKSLNYLGFFNYFFFTYNQNFIKMNVLIDNYVMKLRKYFICVIIDEVLNARL